MSRLVIRELRRLEDYVAAQDVARRVWGFDDRQLPSTFDLQVVGHAGGMTAGAYLDGELVGFVHGLARTNFGRPCHHSHLLAVRPEFRGRDVSVRLKFFQRSWCLARGIRRITWTYDPLLIRNGRLNLVRLRAQAYAFLPNVYGALGGLYGDLPTDRFEVLWRLDSPEVERAARGHAPEPSAVEDLPRAGSGRLPSAKRLAVEIPAGAPELYADDPAAARRARERLRRTARPLFGRGYEAVALAPTAGGALYVFER
jgi:chorismate synthase